MMVEFFINAKFPCNIFTNYDERTIADEISMDLLRVARQGELIRKHLLGVDTQILRDVYEDIKFILKNDDEVFSPVYWNVLRDNYFDEKVSVWDKKKVERHCLHSITDRNYARYQAIFDGDNFFGFYCIYWVYMRNMVVNCLFESVENSEIDNYVKREMLDRLTAIYNDIERIIEAENKHHQHKVNGGSGGKAGKSYKKYEGVIIVHIKDYLYNKELSASDRKKKGIIKITQDNVIDNISNSIYEIDENEKLPSKSNLKEWIKNYTATGSIYLSL